MDRNSLVATFARTWATEGDFELENDPPVEARSQKAWSRNPRCFALAQLLAKVATSIFMTLRACFVHLFLIQAKQILRSQLGQINPTLGFLLKQSQPGLQTLETLLDLRFEQG